MPSRSVKGRVVGLLALAIGSGAGCNLWLTEGDLAVQRATKEFSCPAGKTGILSRSDIYPGLFDVDACGQRARYHCILGKLWTCIREPDPAHWHSEPSLCVRHDATTSKPAACVEPLRPEPKPEPAQPTVDKEPLL